MLRNIININNLKFSNNNPSLIIRAEQMDNLQQSIFHNLSKNTVYNSKSRVIAEKHEKFPKYRAQEIENEFELVDLHNKGKLTQNEIISYLNDKYQWVNEYILKDVFNSMHWDQDQAVSKEQFVDKYLAKERKLYNEINGLTYYSNWVNTLEDIYMNELKMGTPRVYFYTQIKEIQLYYENTKIQWMDLIIGYEDHQTKINYQFQQAQHYFNYPSFQIWLPARSDAFFLRIKFLDPNDSQIVYGQTYVNIPLNEQVNKMSDLDLPITKSGKKVGRCVVYAYAEPSMAKVKQELNEIKNKQVGYKKIAEDKQKEYEYLQFLWGVRHRYPHKIQPLEVTWRLACRVLLIIALGVLGVIVHILGRCEPLSIIIMFLMLRTWQFVYLRHEKFLMTWLTICAILLDIIWISLSSGSVNQINFAPLNQAIIVTYVLLAFKGVLIIYLLLVEKSLITD